MTAKTPRPPPDVQGAVEVGEVKKRCSPSSTPKKSLEQAKPRQPRGFGAFTRSDRSTRRDGYGPYTARRLAEMDKRFSAVMARAHPKLVRP
jgi:hypothetical protein